MGTLGLCPLELSRTVLLGSRVEGTAILTRACRASQGAAPRRGDARSATKAGVPDVAAQLSSLVRGGRLRDLGGASRFTRR